MRFTSPHSSPYARLVANVVEDGECWIGTEKSASSWGYKRVNFRVPGLGGRIVHLSSHILTWLAAETGAESVDELYLFYLEFRASGLELDHTCNVPECRRPVHLEPVTHVENCARRSERRAPRVGMPEPDEVEF